MPNRLLPLLACLALASCGWTPDRAVPVVAPCDLPVDLPDRALNDQEIEVLWGRDRSALRVCAGRVDATRPAQ